MRSGVVMMRNRDLHPAPSGHPRYGPDRVQIGRCGYPSGAWSTKRRGLSPSIEVQMRVRPPLLVIPAIIAATVISMATATIAGAWSVLPGAGHPEPAVAMTEPTRTLAPAPAAPSTSAAPIATLDLTVTQAASSAFKAINQDRAGAGLRPLRLDARLVSIAQIRADTMAREDRLSHVSAAGVSVFDLIDQRHVAWYLAAEIIAWNNWPALADSAAAANRGWMGSSEHHQIIVSTEYNYVGIAMATTPSGGRYWSAVFLRGPDRTAPVVKMTVSTVGAALTLSNGTQRRQVTWRWTGGEVQLASLTSGLRTFQVERRVNGGRWVVVAATRSRSWTGWTTRGSLTQIRVRGIDRAGNVGAWSAPITVSA